MSRYHLVTKRDLCTVVVGWDNPLQSFFISVCDNIEDQEVYSYGTLPGEQCTDLVKFKKIVEKWGNWTEPLEKVLKGDYEARTEPTPLQKKMVAMTNLLSEGEHINKEFEDWWEKNKHEQISADWPVEYMDFKRVANEAWTAASKVIKQ